MECTRFLEERAGGEESPEFRAHRSECAACRQESEEFDEVRELYREASTERYRGGVVRKAGWRAWLPGAAAAAFLVGVLIFVLGGPGDRPPDESSARFVMHLPLEPWSGTDERVDRTMNEVWRRLQRLEGSVE